MEGNNSNNAGAEGEEEEEGPPISWVQDEVLCIILLLLDAKTLMIAVPQVCKFWRSMCQELDSVHLDFRWWGEKKVPLEVVAGWRVLPTLAVAGCANGGGGGSAEGDEAAADDAAPEEERWASGMCALFPHTTSVTMAYEQGVEDAHVHALADKCHKCRGLTHANFYDCDQLTDAAVLALADKCRGLTHANFRGCDNLTDAAVLELADKCRGLTHAEFYECRNLTDAAEAAIAKQHPGVFRWIVEEIN